MIPFESTIEIIQGSVTSKEDLSKLKKFDHFDGIFHLAAKKSVTESQKHPGMYWDINTLGTANIIEVCKNQGWDKIVFTSSGAVYGSLLTNQQIRETEFATPTSVYRFIKLAAESLLSEASIVDGISAISLRCFNLAGGSNSNYFDKKIPTFFL